MGRNKGLLLYRGLPWFYHAYGKLNDLCEKTYLFAGESSSAEFGPYLSPDRVIADQYPGLGPAGAIATLNHVDPKSYWLVVPCDVVLFQSQSAEKFLNLAKEKVQKNPDLPVILTHQSQMEPLIGLYSPSFTRWMDLAYRQSSRPGSPHSGSSHDHKGKEHRMRGFLKEFGFDTVDASEWEGFSEEELFNFNTPEDLKRIFGE